MRNLLAFITVSAALAPIAMAQQYVCTVLYPFESTSAGVHPGTEIIGSRQSSVAGQTVGYGYAGASFPPITHAVLWSAPNGTATDLNPAGFSQSYAYATDGVQQVGYAWNTENEASAMLWSGTATSAVNLTPTGFTDTYAYGLYGNQQVGYGAGSSTGGNYHALLWYGSAASAVDLNPAGFTDSYGYAITGNQIVGFGDGASTGSNQHALYWSSPSATAVDLNPAGYAYSMALGVGSNQEVGAAAPAYNGNDLHATLWNGTAASSVDLNPTGFTSSEAVATNGAEQVGFGQTSNMSGQDEQALVWTGTASSAVALPLPSSITWVSSWATSIDADGNIFGYAYGIPNGYFNYAVEWSPVPEPGSLSILAIGVLISTRVRRALR